MHQPTFFQGDSFINSQIVNEAWETLSNYLVETTSEQKELCVIYFSSNGIYYPNEEATFRDRVISHNVFEWYKSRIDQADKHIFVRDVFKQWYVKGINIEVPDHDSLLRFLRQATEGYRRVVTVGSSAGGYAAILFGCLLQAERIFAFCPQISIAPLVESASSAKNPVLQELRGSSLLKYADLSMSIDMDSPAVVYFYSALSQIDVQQHALLDGCSRLHIVQLDSDVHGVQCPVECLPHLLKYDEKQWSELCARSYSPKRFVQQVLGFTGAAIWFSRKLIKKFLK